MLRKLTKNKVSKFLRLVAEMKDTPVFADDPVLFLTHVDHELCSKDGVVTRSNYAHLQQTNYFIVVKYKAF
jgi:hypothetical protein